MILLFTIKILVETVLLTKAAEETRSEEEPSKSKSLFILVAISLHANRKKAITWPYQLFRNAILPIMPVYFKYYINKSHETK